MAKTMAWESIYVALAGLTGGLILGIALDKVMFLVITKVIGGEISLGFFISGQAVKSTIILFIVVFFLIFLNAVRQIHLSNPLSCCGMDRQGKKSQKPNG